MFEDSKLSKKMAELVAKEVLGPFFLKIYIVKIIKLKIKSIALQLRRTKNDFIRNLKM